ncbi:MAG: hypothetical protein ABFR19_09535, partial [Pseudomonadota bacterium]
MRLSFPFRRCHADRHGVALVKPRKIYIFPTRYGFLYGLLVILVLLISVNYANNPAFLLAFLLAGLGIVAMLHTWRNLLNLKLQPGRAAAVFAGQPAAFEIRVHNSREAERPNIRLRLPAGEEAETDLPADRMQSLMLHARETSRGRMALPRLRLSTRYPLGLFRAWCYVELEVHALVYPAPGRSMSLASAADDSGRTDMGSTSQHFRGADEFIGLRRYRAGDA